MIKPEELRIGNYIYDDLGNLSKVTGFSPFGHSTRCDEEEGCYVLIDYFNWIGKLYKGYEIESNLCTPIELTEEILLKFGFTDIKYKGDDNVDFNIDRNGVTNSVTICIKNGVIVDYEHLKYLHQLQNLYYLESGQELEIKL